MPWRRALPFLAAAVVALTYAPDSRALAVPEIPVPWLDDIAVARLTAQGPVIYYNPKTCKEVGVGVCSFFRVHEYGHIVLHHEGAYYTKLLSGRAIAEMEADCFAAKNAQVWQVRAAINWFLAPERIDFDAGDHGTGRERAKRLKECRGLS
jgi:hypothetical protein